MTHWGPSWPVMRRPMRSYYDEAGKLARTISGFGQQAGQFNGPTDVEVSPDGRVYVVDLGNARVTVFSRHGAFVRSFGSFGASGAGLNVPNGIHVHGGRVFVVDTGNSRVQVYGLDGTYVRSIGGVDAAQGALLYPCDVLIDADGQVCVSDPTTGAISVFTLEGALVDRVAMPDGDGYYSPEDLSLDEQGALFAAV